MPFQRSKIFVRLHLPKPDRNQLEDVKCLYKKINKRTRITNGKSRMDNLEKLAILGTQVS